MKEYPMHLPITFSYKRNKFEERLILFSNRIFKKFSSGIVFALTNNILYLYLWYHKMSFFYMFIFSFILILIFFIIIIQLVGTK